jgi:hypothetical protein
MRRGTVLRKRHRSHDPASFLRIEPTCSFSLLFISRPPAEYFEGGAEHRPQTLGGKLTWNHALQHDAWPLLMHDAQHADGVRALRVNDVPPSHGHRLP